jgi:NhaP-type Na+/H+ or K+/H+ antiporter
MSSFDPAGFNSLIALIGVLVLVAGLMSGMIERVGLPAVAVFLALGTLLGPNGLGLIDFSLGSPALMTIAILSLVLVLFTDAVSVSMAQVRQHLKVAVIVLGPGTLISAAMTAVVAWQVLELPLAAAAILGAALASTDPVMMRGLLRLPEVPSAARYPLRIESGFNDVVVLPIVLLGMAVLAAGEADATSSLRSVGLSVFVLGPLAGVVVAFVAVRALVWARGWMGMRRDYESLYVLGIAFTAYAVAEVFHASGFMAAFAAGLTVSSADVELCDCFKDYGEATSEMLLLLSFVAFGTSLIWTGLEVLSGPTLLVAAVALLGRPLVLLLLLPRGRDPVARNLIIWFGPRGLSSLLLILLPIIAGIGGSERLFPVTALVVLLSVVIHGTMLAWATQRLKAHAEPEESAAAPSHNLPAAKLVSHPELITFEELEQLRAAGAPVVLLDVRSSRGYKVSPLTAQGAIRLRPEAAVESAAGLALPREAWLVAYCA